MHQLRRTAINFPVSFHGSSHLVTGIVSDSSPHPIERYGRVQADRRVGQRKDGLGFVATTDSKSSTPCTRSRVTYTTSFNAQLRGTKDWIDIDEASTLYPCAERGQPLSRRLLHAININLHSLVIEAHVSGNRRALRGRVSIVPYKIPIKLAANTNVVILRATLIRTQCQCAARCEILPIDARRWQVMPSPQRSLQKEQGVRTFSKCNAVDSYPDVPRRR